MATWGFTFSNVVFTWIKTNKNTNSLFWGMGNSTRANPEYVLLGKKGKLKRQNADVHSVLLSPIKQHSQKPNEIRNRITRLYGDLPRIELFARTKVHGWSVIGNDEKLQNEPLEAYL
jgi:N6-adenosine-specific RNA methylase IME4